VRVPDVRPFPDGHAVNISLSKGFLVRNLILLPALSDTLSSGGSFVELTGDISSLMMPEGTYGNREH
jgi:hypothetical protein